MRSPLIEYVDSKAETVAISNYNARGFRQAGRVEREF